MFKIKYFLDNKEIDKERAIEIYGEHNFSERLLTATVSYLDNPEQEIISFVDGFGIEFGYGDKNEA